MVVTNGTSGREPHPHRGCRLCAIACVEDQVFLVDCAALVGRDVAAIEAAGNAAVENVFGTGIGTVIVDEITGELPNRKLVKRHVFIEGIDHPLPVAPHLAKVVVMNAVGIGIPSVVEPEAATVFAPFRTRQQHLDKTFVGIASRIGHKGLYDSRFGRQSR